jgi:hypothetical protein
MAAFRQADARERESFGSLRRAKARARLDRAPWTIRIPPYNHVEANAELVEYKCVPFAEELLYKDLEKPASPR